MQKSIEEQKADNNANYFSVFLADDDADDRFLFQEALAQLKSATIGLTSFSSGLQLMSHLAVGKNPLPKLIFLDLNMPVKNGFACLKEIREDEKLKNLNIIIYSTSSQFKDILDTLNKGANLYFTKPASFPELVVQLEKIFSMNWEEYRPAVTIDNYLFTTDGMGF
jgi:CheY-like chemotaxis protein